MFELSCLKNRIGITSRFVSFVIYYFGDVKFFIPHNWDNYWDTRYGDYMRLLEKNKRYGHKLYKYN